MLVQAAQTMVQLRQSGEGDARALALAAERGYVRYTVAKAEILFRGILLIICIEEITYNIACKCLNYQFFMLIVLPIVEYY